MESVNGTKIFLRLPMRKYDSFWRKQIGTIPPSLLKQKRHWQDDVVTPGTTIVVTDAPALPISSSHREVLLMKAEQK